MVLHLNSLQLPATLRCYVIPFAILHILDLAKVTWRALAGKGCKVSQHWMLKNGHHELHAYHVCQCKCALGHPWALSKVEITTGLPCSVAR